AQRPAGRGDGAIGLDSQLDDRAGTLTSLEGGEYDPEGTEVDPHLVVPIERPQFVPKGIQVHQPQLPSRSAGAFDDHLAEHELRRQAALGSVLGLLHRAPPGSAARGGVQRDGWPPPPRVSGESDGAPEVRRPCWAGWNPAVPPALRSDAAVRSCAHPRRESPLKPCARWGVLRPSSLHRWRMHPCTVYSSRRSCSSPSPL